MVNWKGCRRKRYDPSTVHTATATPACLVNSKSGRQKRRRIRGRGKSEKQ